jgi:hypothetical protein
LRPVAPLCAISGESGAFIAGSGSENGLRSAALCAKGLGSGGVGMKLPYWSVLPSPVSDSSSPRCFLAGAATCVDGVQNCVPDSGVAEDARAR